MWSQSQDPCVNVSSLTTMSLMKRAQKCLKFWQSTKWVLEVGLCARANLQISPKTVVSRSVMLLLQLAVECLRAWLAYAWSVCFFLSAITWPMSDEPKRVVECNIGVHNSVAQLALDSFSVTTPSSA